MNWELVEVGKTYVGRKGKPRTVVSVPNKFVYGDISYHNGDASRVNRCWCFTLGSWAVGEKTATEEELRDKRLRAEAPAMLEALKKAYQVLTAPQTGEEFDDAVQFIFCVIARAEGKKTA